MSRQLFQRYSLLFFSINAILICGSSRRIPRRASCPSCSQDCPEALTVQLPWYSYQESNLQPQDFSVNPFKHSDSRLMQGGISQDMIHDDIPSNANSMAFGNYIYPQQESANRNLFFRNVPNKFPESLNRQEIFPRNEPASEYSFAHVFPQSFDRSKNLFYRSPRDKSAESSPKNRNFQDYRENKQDLATKVFTPYRADRDTLSDDSRNIFPNIYPQGLSRPERPFLPREENVLEERNLIKVPNSVDRQYKFANPHEAYYPEIKHNLPFLPQNLNVQKIPKDEKVFNNLDKNSLQSWNLGQLEQAENNFLEMYPARDEQMILTEADEQINHNPYSKLILPQDLNIWKSIKDGKSYDNWNFISRNSPQESAEIRQWQEENNWPQFYPPSNDITLFAEGNQDKEGYSEEDLNQRYFKDEIDKDTVKIEKHNYNPYHSSQNMDIWGRETHKEPFDNLDFMFENPQDNQKELEMYSQDNKYFQGKGNEDVPFNDEARDEIDEVTRKLVDPSFIDRLLNIFNNRKHSVQSSESSQKSTRYNTLHQDSVDDSNARFFDNKAVQDTQDLILPKDVLGIKEFSEYNIPLINTRQNIKDVRNKLSREIDPDLFDDIENPPTESTESPIESHVEFSTPQK